MYRFTARRKNALRKAQLISARKRKRHGKKMGFSAGKRKLSRGHKRAIAMVAAGSLAAGAGAGIWKYTSSRKRPKQTPPGEVRPSRPALTGTYPEVTALSLATGGAAQSRVIEHTHQIKINTTVTHPLVLEIMKELHGKPVKGYYAGVRRGKGTYKVITGS